MKSLIFPSAATHGSTVAIIAPASVVRPEYVYGAQKRIEAAGFRVKVMPHALGPADGSYASTASERLADLHAAWTDPDVSVILCARGGYGCVHLLEGLSDAMLQSSPKWLIGFSDVSALHARLAAAGIASVHGSMAKYIASADVGDSVLEALLHIVAAEAPTMDYTIPSSSYNGRRGNAQGVLKGGNLAVLSHLMSTPFDMFAGEDTILFIEDVAEAIYATERMLWQMKLNGVFASCKGVVVGSFTESRADRNFSDTASMINRRFSEWGIIDRIPVVFNFPVGHIEANLPLIQGAAVCLTDDGHTVRLQSIK